MDMLNIGRDNDELSVRSVQNRNQPDSSKELSRSCTPRTSAGYGTASQHALAPGLTAASWKKKTLQHKHKGVSSSRHVQQCPPPPSSPPHVFSALYRLFVLAFDSSCARLCRNSQALAMICARYAPSFPPPYSHAARQGAYICLE